MTDPGAKAAGGRARAAALSPERRKAISQKAIATRNENRDAPKVIAGTAEHPLVVSGIEIECYVLEDDTRVITQGALLTSLGRSRRMSGGRAEGFSDDSLPPILQPLSLRPFVSDEARLLVQPIRFRLPSGALANGYRAEALPEVCEIFLSARDAKTLTQKQKPIAAQAELLMRGLARVGIVALVDEATGYQAIRTKDALSRILDAYVAKEIAKWVRTFPAEFYEELFRLKGLPYDDKSVHRPRNFAGITNDIIYDRLAPGVKDELKAEQKKVNRSTKMFQHLTPTVGYVALRQHLGSVITLMKLSDSWLDFKNKLDRFHPSYRGDTPLDLWQQDF